MKICLCSQNVKHNLNANKKGKCIHTQKIERKILVGSQEGRQARWRGETRKGGRKDSAIRKCVYKF
jgi:hypothetical protein